MAYSTLLIWANGINVDEETQFFPLDTIDFFFSDFKQEETQNDASLI